MKVERIRSRCESCEGTGASDWRTVVSADDRTRCSTCEGRGWIWSAPSDVPESRPHAGEAVRKALLAAAEEIEESCDEDDQTGVDFACGILRVHADAALAASPPDGTCQQQCDEHGGALRDCLDKRHYRPIPNHPSDGTAPERAQENDDDRQVSNDLLRREGPREGLSGDAGRAGERSRGTDPQGRSEVGLDDPQREGLLPEAQQAEVATRSPGAAPEQAQFIEIISRGKNGEQLFSYAVTAGRVSVPELFEMLEEHGHLGEPHPWTTPLLTAQAATLREYADENARLEAEVAELRSGSKMIDDALKSLRSLRKQNGDQVDYRVEEAIGSLEKLSPKDS